MSRRGLCPFGVFCARGEGHIFPVFGHMED